MMWMAMVPLCNPFMDQDWSRTAGSSHHGGFRLGSGSHDSWSKSQSRRRSHSLTPRPTKLVDHFNNNNNDDPFEVRLDVGNFKLSDLKVRTVTDSVIIEGNLDDKGVDYGFRSSSFSRKYPLPKSVDPKDLTATLDKANKVLTLRAKRRKSISSTNRGQKRDSIITVTKGNGNSPGTSKETTPMSAHSSFEA